MAVGLGTCGAYRAVSVTCPACHVGLTAPWFALLRSYLASRLGVLSLLTPLFGIGFGVLVLHDRLTWPFLLGALVILAGILLVNARDLMVRSRRRGSTAPIPAITTRSRP